MAVILQKIGKINEFDMSFVRSEDALEYVQSLNVGSETPYKFLDKLTYLSKDIRNLMKGML
jgi:hypothetical protein